MVAQQTAHTIYFFYPSLLIMYVNTHYNIVICLVITCQRGGVHKLASELHHALEIQAPPPVFSKDTRRCLC
jgi:NADH:ubiquinone oxidoreductase subunit E